MQSRDLIRHNLVQSANRVLTRIEEMEPHAFVFPTPRGGCHTCWVLGHLAYIEVHIVQHIMLGQAHPLSDWQRLFDGDEPTANPDAYPPFGDVLAACRGARAATLAVLDGFEEAALDRRSANVPPGWDQTFGTYRLSLQFVADHWYMHRAHLGDARRAAGLTRMWV